MSERKTLNKYYPPDFDPSKIAKRKKAPAGSAAASLPTVRLMAPFSMRCTTCGEFIYKGKKFNARKELTGEDYQSIKIIRFYIRCPRCSGEIRFKTDPKINDYRCEYGAVRNHEPWRDREQEEETPEQRLDRLEREEKEMEERKERERMYGPAAGPKPDDEDKDVMEAAEERALDAKREMEIQDELDELRARNARIDQAAAYDGLIDKAKASVAMETEKTKEDLEDEEAARLAFEKTSNGDNLIRKSPPVPATNIPAAKVTKPAVKKRPNSLGVVVNKKKKKPLI